MTKFKMNKHPEGGYYVETYRSTLMIEGQDGKSRSSMTSIIYLLNEGDFSTYHKVLGDEMWCYHAGCDMEIHVLDPKDGKDHVFYCGVGTKASLQVLVPGGLYFAAKPVEDQESKWSCCGCIVTPGFEFEDFSIAKRDDLLLKYPTEKDIIIKLTK